MPLQLRSGESGGDAAAAQIGQGVGVPAYPAVELLLPRGGGGKRGICQQLQVDNLPFQIGGAGDDGG